MGRKLFILSLIFMMVFSVTLQAFAGEHPKAAAATVQQEVDRASEAAKDSPDKVDTSEDSGEGADAAWQYGDEGLE